MACYAISYKLNIPIEKFNILNFSTEFINDECEMTLDNIDEFFNKSNSFRELLTELNIIDGIKIHKDYESIFYLKNNTKTILLCNMNKFKELAKKIQNRIGTIIDNTLTFDDLANSMYKKDKIEENDYKIYYQFEYQSNILKKKDLLLKKKRILLSKEKKKKNLIAHGIPKNINTTKKYLNTQDILKLCDAPFGIVKFNNILKLLNYITKIEYKPSIFSKYILIDDGLQYGDNIANKNNFSYIEKLNLKAFPWVEYDVHINEYINKYEFILYDEILCIPSCTIFWYVDSFLELYQKVCNIYIDELNAKIIERPKSERQQERESWLKNIECPGCQSKNIHKKDKRQRRDFEVQRYQCRDCKKIFQKRID